MVQIFFLNYQIINNKKKGAKKKKKIEIKSKGYT